MENLHNRIHTKHVNSDDTEKLYELQKRATIT